MKKLKQTDLKIIGSLFVLIFLVASIAIIVRFLPEQRETHPRAATTNFPTQSPDGRLRFSSTNWPPDPLYTCIENNSMTTIGVGQFPIGDPIPTYKADRGYFIFNTSSIPSYAIVNSVTLRVRVSSDQSDTNFDVQVYDYDWTTPVSCSDDWVLPGSYVAARNTSAISGGLLDIGLPPSVINKGASTKLIFTSSREVNNNKPTGNEYITIYSGDSTTPSELIVNYTASPPTADIKADGSNGPITIAHNNSATISWASSNATSCTVSPTGWSGTSNTGVSTGNLSGPKSYTYTLTCTGAGGSASDSVIVNVSAPPGPSPGPSPRPGPGPAPSPGPGITLETMQLTLSAPYLIGKMKIPLVISGYTKEIEVSPDKKEYSLDVKEANISVGSSLTIVVGGNKTLIKKIQITPNSETTAVSVGDLMLGDITGDNKIDDKDTVALLDSIAKQTLKGDLNADKVTNSLDWAILLANFGKSGDL